jgi:hypothetical protein
MTLVSSEKLFAEFEAKPPANPDSVARCQSHLKFQPIIFDSWGR